MIHIVTGWLCEFYIKGKDIVYSVKCVLTYEDTLSCERETELDIDTREIIFCTLPLKTNSHF